ncbi:hypothetical protein CROQUDRAFT_668505 [Cronartium quercuum f. sp. fusiforme G11]|uniref:Uncharacterized protein n=1 Tax=Cronartium quercuum f. sp. fusiforme G11 TaxID=708437 RepID=A0A9P6NS45_9BASI|nr:hypothetical protein CROQUDRAFT_668505 [Cronartium quercuum f. sp. fusiforme G11]
MRLGQSESRGSETVKSFFKCLKHSIPLVLIAGKCLNEKCAQFFQKQNRNYHPIVETEWRYADWVLISQDSLETEKRVPYQLIPNQVLKDLSKGHTMDSTLMAQIAADFRVEFSGIYSSVKLAQKHMRSSTNSLNRSFSKVRHLQILGSILGVARCLDLIIISSTAYKGGMYRILSTPRWRYGYPCSPTCRQL